MLQILDHVTAIAGISLLLAFLAAFIRRRRTSPVLILAMMTTPTLRGNAMLTGALSGPHDRH